MARVRVPSPSLGDCNTSWRSSWTVYLVRIGNCSKVFRRSANLSSGSARIYRVSSNKAGANFAEAEALNKAGPVEEFRFSLPSARSQVLFCALLKRCGVKAYRYRGQKRSTINARVSRRCVDRLLWPQYREFASVLDTFFDGLAFQVISDARSSPVRFKSRSGRNPQKISFVRPAPHR